jgi:hypothetical protein
VWIGAGVIVAGILIFLAYRRPALSGDRIQDDRISGFRVRLAAEELSFSEEQIVRLTFTVCRSRILVSSTSSAGGADVLVDYRVTDPTGRIVEDSSKQIMTMELRRVFWIPGQCRSAPIEWKTPSQVNQRSDHQTNGYEGADVGGNTYEISARWLSGRWDATPHPIEPAQTVTVTVHA